MPKQISNLDNAFWFNLFTLPLMQVLKSHLYTKTNDAILGQVLWNDMALIR